MGHCGVSGWTSICSQRAAGGTSDVHGDADHAGFYAHETTGGVDGPYLREAGPDDFPPLFLPPSGVPAAQPESSWRTTLKALGQCATNSTGSIIN